MYKEFLINLKNYAITTSHIESIIIVGSYANHTETESSDLDVVIITRNKKKMLQDQKFTQNFGKVIRQRTEYYGVCTSIRSRYKDGKEIEFGLVDPTWISKPLDAGTYKVLSDGYKILIDKKHYFKDLKIWLFFNKVDI